MNLRGTKTFLLWPLILVGFLGLTALVIFGGPGARVIARWFEGDGVGVTLGRVVDVSGGRVSLVRGPRAEVVPFPLERPVALIDGDHLETDAAAQAIFTLNSQDELILNPRSAVSIELWNERDVNSPIYVHVLAGDVSSRRAGVRGRAFVVRDGRLFLPSQRPGQKVAPLLITRGAQSPDLQVDAPPAPATDAAEEFTPAPTEPAPEAAATTSDPATLANEYVDEVISSRQAQFQKCWLSRLKDKPSLRGTLTVQFEITRRGRVRDAKVTDSTLGDQRLGACVQTVVERLPFRSFTGPEISISYPITFE